METINPTFSYTNHIENIDLNKCTKSIRLSSNNFCICVHQTDDNKLYLINQYDIPLTLSEKELMGYIAETNKQLQIDCKKNFFYFYTKINTQIPNEYYTKEGNEHILSLLTSNAENYTPVNEHIDLYDFQNLSAWETSTYNDIKNNFPDFKLKTTISNLFLILHHYNQSEKKALIFVDKKHFTILAADKNYFLGANGFHFVNEADFTYFTVNFIRKIFAQTNDIQIIICGNIEENSPVFQSLKKYFNQSHILQHTHSNEIENYHYFCDMF